MGGGDPPHLLCPAEIADPDLPRVSASMLHANTPVTDALVEFALKLNAATVPPAVIEAAMPRLPWSMSWLASQAE